MRANLLICLAVAILGHVAACIAFALTQWEGAAALSGIFLAPLVFFYLVLEVPLVLLLTYMFRRWGRGLPQKIALLAASIMLFYILGGLLTPKVGGSRDYMKKAYSAAGLAFGVVSAFSCAVYLGWGKPGAGRAEKR